jgi:hypothetical protein
VPNNLKSVLVTELCAEQRNFMVSVPI